MKLKHAVNLLLIALFVWVSQNTILHFQHYGHEEISECNVCDTSHKIKLYQHTTDVVVMNENLAVIVREEVEKVLVKARFDYTDVPQFKKIDILKHSQYTDRFIALGFNATAPPVYFS